MERVRYRGRYVKQKVLQKTLNFIAMRSGKQSAKNGPEEPFSIYVRRVVEPSELKKNMKCRLCKKSFRFDDLVGEKHEGYHSIWICECSECHVRTSVYTGKSHIGPDGKRYYDVNSKLILGALHAGSGCAQLRKIAACLNLPDFSDKFYKRYEREVGPIIEESAKESCRKAAKEEREMVVANLDHLCQQLPPEIVSEIYPNLDAMRTEGRAEFDASLGNVISIIVSYDMGWSKRGNGRSYDSLNGYGAIIGFLTGKVLEYGTRNRKCKKCSVGHSKIDHDCRLNFQGSAKGMEADLADELVNKSAALKAAGVNVRVIIGDDDSSAIKKIRAGSVLKIFKLSDRNHLKKHYSNDLYGIQDRYKEMRRKKTIAHLKKCFSYAVAKNKGQSDAMKKALLNIPHHVYGDHSNCGNWCTRRRNNGKPTILLKDPDLFKELVDIHTKYANNALKFAMAADSQAKESLNNMMAHKALKNNCYSLSESADYRFGCVICEKNEGCSYLLTINNKLLLSPGKNTASYAAKQHAIRLRRAERLKDPASKKRRLELRQMREALRKKTENQEWTMYKPNCGLDADDVIMDFEEDDRDLNIGECSMATSITPDSCVIVYFDLETSGFLPTAEILQIAAKCEGREFNIYALPTQEIDDKATKITGLREICGQLYHYHKHVDAVSLVEALRAFLDFLSSQSTFCLLVAHNASFDYSRLVRAIKDNSMTQDFGRVVAGFADTVPLLRAALPERRGTGLFKLQKLAEDFLHLDSSSGKFHEALYDVEVLEKLRLAFISKGELCSRAKLFSQVLKNVIRQRKGKIVIQHLDGLQGVLSDGMLKKVSEAGITLSKLREVYTKNGKKGIFDLLAKEGADEKALVTGRKKIIHRVIEFLANE